MSSAHPSTPLRICFLCSGNICRSPMGEVILVSLLERAGLADRAIVDSAGTGDWHVGESADRRTVAALRAAGYDGSAHRAAWFDPAFVASRDLVLVADRGHLRAVRRMLDAHAARGQGSRGQGNGAQGTGSQGTGNQGARLTAVRLLREFDPAAVDAGTLEVDDPYYGDAADFRRCCEEVERACQGIVTALAAGADLTAEAV